MVTHDNQTLRTNGIQLSTELINLGLTDQVVQVCKAMMMSDNKDVRYDSVELYCKLARAEHTIYQDKILRTHVLAIIKQAFTEIGKDKESGAVQHCKCHLWASCMLWLWQRTYSNSL